MGVCTERGGDGLHPFVPGTLSCRCGTVTRTEAPAHELVLLQSFHTGARFGCTCGTPLGWFSRTGRKLYAEAVKAQREHERLVAAIAPAGQA